MAFPLLVFMCTHFFRAIFVGSPFKRKTKMELRRIVEMSVRKILHYLMVIAQRSKRQSENRTPLKYAFVQEKGTPAIQIHYRQCR